MRGNENIIFSSGQHGVPKFIAFVQIYRDNAGGARIAEGLQRSLFYSAPTRHHKHKTILFVQVAYGQKCSDSFSLRKVQQIHDGPTPGGPSRFGQFMHFAPIQPAQVCEKQHVLMGRSDEEVAHKIILFRIHAGDASAAATLFAIGSHGQAFDIALIGYRYHHVLIGDEVFDAELAQFVQNLGAPFIPIGILDLEYFLAHFDKDRLFTGKDVS